MFAVPLAKIYWKKNKKTINIFAAIGTKKLLDSLQQYH